MQVKWRERKTKRQNKKEERWKMKSDRYHFVHLLLTSVNTWTTVMEYVLPYNVCLSTHLHSNDLVGHHLHPMVDRLHLVVLQAVVLSRMCGEVKIHLSGSCIVAKYMKGGIEVNRWKNNILINMHVSLFTYFSINAKQIVSFHFEYVIMNFNEHWLYLCHVI